VAKKEYDKLTVNICHYKFGRTFAADYETKIRRNIIMMIWIIFIGFMILSWIVSLVLKSKFKKYAKIPVDNGMSGRDVAERMLRDHGITDVRIESVPGHLSDHYNPVNKTINLSPEVYSGRNISAAAVAAHECGHAVQHAKAYAWLGFRSKLVPAVSFSSKWVQWILLGGILLVNTFPALLLAGIILFALTTIFSFITLPVEINASQQALAWLSNAGITSYQNHDKAQDALKWAAYTYVVAALGSLATLLYYIMIFVGARD
jgi:Zn-dependent membrane protease YugP